MTGKNKASMDIFIQQERFFCLRLRVVPSMYQSQLDWPIKAYFSAVDGTVSSTVLNESRIAKGGPDRLGPSNLITCP